MAETLAEAPMARDDARGPEAVRPQLIRGDEGTRLSRQLVGVAVKRLVDFLNRASTLRYTRASGLSDFECRVLSWVCEYPDLSLGELAAHVNRGVAQTSRTVKRLVGMGLLRSRGRGGGPGVIISPSPLGRTVYTPLIAMAIEADRQLVEGLTEDELAGFWRGVELLTQNALTILGHEQQLSQDDPDAPR